MLAVGFESPDLEAKAQNLADSLGLSLNNQAELCLWVSANKLSLRKRGFSPLSADFRPESWKKRRDEGKKQGLVRACKPKAGLFIIDISAGWGKDAAILASFGADVLMLERNPILAVLLADALQNQTKDSLKLSFQAIEARLYLERLKPEFYPDVIYYDPMHPTRQKSALVKKELQILQELMGEDKDVLDLLKLAITKVKQRVVVKWPQNLSALLPPNTSVVGKTVRFDVYTHSSAVSI